MSTPLESTQVYRPSPRTIVITSLLVGFGGLVLVVLPFRRGGADELWLASPLLLAGLVVLGLLLGTALRSATIVAPEGLTLRGLFGAKRLAWSDIQGIKVEPPTAPSRQGPAAVVAVYDSRGQRFELPHVNDRNIEDLPHEARTLNQLWGRHRGADWVPKPAVLKAGVDRQARTQLMFLTALISGLGSLLVMLALFVVLLFAAPPGGFDGGLLGALTDPVMILIVPACVVVVTLVVVRLRRSSRSAEPS